MYIVVDEFNDLKDNNHNYKKDSIFPYEKRDVEENRINELSSDSNKLNKILIKKIEIEEATEEQLIEFARREGLDIRQMILSAIDIVKDSNDKELKELRKQAKKMKIDFSEETDIEELKQLIENAGNKE